jgi:probable rRNA maturation factor
MAPSANPSIEILGAPPQCPARLLRPFAKEILDLCGLDEVGLAIAFVDDEEIRRLNREYRGKDTPTDVLSFPLDEETPDGVRYLGDIAVSLPTAGRQAADLGHSLRREVLILAAHGIIHLAGHDHESDSGEMDRLERRARETILPRYCAE